MAKTKTKEPLGLALTKLILSTSLIVSIGALIGAIGYMVSYPRITPSISVAPTVTQPLPTEILSINNWQTYRNEEREFELKYPNNFEVLANDSNSQKYPSFRDKKYDGGYEWPGLDINWPSANGSKIPETESRVFKTEDAKNDIITINFTYNGDKSIIASCKLYGDQKVIDVCNKIIATFQPIEEKIFLTNEQIIKAIGKISKLKDIRYNGSYGDYGLDEKDNKLLIFSKISDLNNDGAPEIIFETVNYDKNIYKLYIVSVNSQTDEFDKISESRLLSSWRLGEIKDINKDGVKEIFMEPEGRGGFANRHGYSILAVNLRERKTNYIQIKNTIGEVLDYFELEGGGGTGRCNYGGWILDKNLNNQNYIISFESIVKNGRYCVAEDGQFDDSRPETDYSLCAECKIAAYKWDGSDFTFDKQAGEILKKSINLEEFDGNDCRSCESWQ